MDHGVHHLPGRIRYKIAGLAPAEMRAVGRVLERCDDVEHVEVRPSSSSLIVHYDPAHTDVPRLGRCIEAGLRTVPRYAAPEPPRERRAPRVSDEAVAESVRYLGVVFGQAAFKVALEQAVRGGLNSLHRSVLAKG